MKDTKRKNLILGIVIAVATVLAIIGLPKLFSGISRYYLKHPIKALGLPVSLKTIFIAVTIIVVLIILYLLRKKKQVSSQVITEQAVEHVMQSHGQSSGVINEKDHMNLF